MSERCKQLNELVQQLEERAEFFQIEYEKNKGEKDKLEDMLNLRNLVQEEVEGFVSKINKILKPKISRKKLSDWMERTIKEIKGNQINKKNQQ